MSSGSTAQSSVNVPAFLTKLWKLVEDPNYDHLIHWSQNGKSFIILNQAQFSKELLPLYFKHNNMASFIRQLNMYGFRKLTNIEHSGLRSERDDIEFHHPYFVKNQESSLEFIKRKIKNPLPLSTSKGLDENRIKTDDDVGSILMDVKAIKGKQESVDDLLVNLQKENEALWKEIAMLRHKHLKQQQMVEKLIQFLMSLVHQRRIPVKRKSPLMMIGSNTDGLGDAKRMAKSNEIQHHHNGPLIFDVSDDLIDGEFEENSPVCPIVNTADLSPLGVDSEENKDSVPNALSLTAAAINDSSDVESLSSLTPVNYSSMISNSKNLDLASSSNLMINPASTLGANQPQEVAAANLILGNQLNLDRLPVTSGIKVVPSTSNGNLILTIEPNSQLLASNATDACVDVNSLQIENKTDQALENSLDSPRPGQPLNCTSPEPTLNTPTISYSPSLIKSISDYNDASASSTDSSGLFSSLKNSSDNFSVLKRSDFYRENLADQIENIDSDLNWLQEQLASHIGDEEGLNFDVNSLMDLDLAVAP